MKQLVVALFCFGVLTTGCTKSSNTINSVKEQISIPFKAEWPALQTSIAYSSPAANKGGLIGLPEVSGMVSSKANAGKVWVHEDSGQPNKIYLLATDSTRIEKSYTVSCATNVDWEELAMGPSKNKAGNFLYLADFGDNNAVRDDMVIYRFAEPVWQVGDTSLGIVANCEENELPRGRAIGVSKVTATLTDPNAAFHTSVVPDFASTFLQPLHWHTDPQYSHSSRLSRIFRPTADV